MPRKTKPDSALSIGQFRAKYALKRLTSETIRKRLIVLVMKWETPSKKKNYDCISNNFFEVRGRNMKHTLDVLTVITSMTQLATTTRIREMILRTRMTFKVM
jgi:hypothetical protein